ncbi:MAG: ABC transporter permease [Chloroflexota bacterium]
MNIQESFITALDSIRANKLRSILTMLGIIIGVASVIALLAIGNGFTEDITGEINSIGTNVITVTTDQDNSGGYPALTLDDVEALQDPINNPDVVAVGAATQGNQTVTFEGESVTTSVIGATENFHEIQGFDAYQVGDGLNQNDIDTQARVAILGAAVSTDLFSDAYPVGEEIKINGIEYEVIGVMEETDNADDNIYIPLTTAQSRLYTDRTRTGEKYVSQIVVEAVDTDTVPLVIDQVTLTLSEEHNIRPGDEYDFTITDLSSLLDVAGSVTSTLNTFLGSIAAISLVVGGIGIMNIMLVSVTERTREIGVRKAFGAKRWDILLQFLLESVVLSLMGGFIGIVLGITVSVVAGIYFGLTMVVASSTIALSVGFAAAVGLIFGIYPAWQASNLRPIEALRYE